jgi:hypothetical protein
VSLRVRFRFDGRCSVHARYNPERDGRPQDQKCPGCESLHVIYLYSFIARRRAESGDGLFVSRPQSQPEAEGQVEDHDAASDIASAQDEAL